ncbi:hypothetical protein NI454_11105 [Brevundimonas diminuta]|uniref:LPS translocon maturation chaperone LptM n=1 Tax=Brevundimonas diminuta TaxID=293 RepID=UPI00209753B6|nr:hypothetical protein [Brevundimonas diminuta]MCO8030496.1 hypothetical protein [Brevundimonas diminuta]
MTKTPVKKTLILAGAALMLAGCGRMADLEPPQGATPKKQTERAIRDRSAPGLREEAMQNLPPRQMPIDNGTSNPFGKPPPMN